MCNNGRLNFDLKELKSTNNSSFNRALELYNSSFDCNQVECRFLLIFSCLEAIFNLDSEEITKKLGIFCAKLLCEENLKEYKIIHDDIKRLYKKRCDYIHGSKTNNISIDDEYILRKYTRKIVFIYWLIILKTKHTAKQINKFLKSDEKLPYQIILLVKCLNSDDFDTQQKNYKIMYKIHLYLMIYI